MIVVVDLVLIALACYSSSLIDNEYYLTHVYSDPIISRVAKLKTGQSATVTQF